MLLSCRFLNDVQGVNSWQYIGQAEMYQGDTQNVYIQLIDASLDRNEQNYNPPGRRYCPPATSTLSIRFKSMDDARVVVRAAVQAFPTLDASIFYIPILGSDPLAGTVMMEGTLVEPSRTLYFKNAKGVMLRVR